MASPRAGDAALPDDLKEYAGQQVDNGEKAKAYAEKYLGRHLEEIGGGKSYAQVSTEQMANPDDESWPSRRRRCSRARRCAACC